MTEEQPKFDPLLLQLVLSLQAGVMQQMGKIVSPATGKIERDLELAHVTIDIIAMLETKMKGNLTDDEAKLIGRVLYELRLNYVDETKKGESRPEESADESDASEERPDADRPQADSGAPE